MGSKLPFNFKDFDILKFLGWFKNSKSKSPEKVFLGISLSFGLIFVFLFPPYMVIDEPSHFFRAYQLTQGEIIGIKKQHDVVGGNLPVSVSEQAGKYGYMIFQYKEKAHLGDIKADLKQKLEPEKRSFIAFNNTVVYPPLTYLPQIIGIKLSTLFNAPPIVSLYFARLASLFFWIVAIYWLIKLIPIGKWTLVVIGAFPMILSQAASASSDATINTITILTIGIITTLIVRSDHRDKMLLWVLSGLAFILSFTKLPAVFILLLALAIPKDRFRVVWGKWKFLLPLFSLAVIATILWNYAALPLRVDLRPEVSATEQLSYILQHPLDFLGIFSVYAIQPRIDLTIAQLYGWLGWNEIKLPLWMVFYGFGALLLTLFDPIYRTIKIPKVVRIIFLVTVFIICSIITTLLYLTWMPVEHEFLYDIWGRYFIAFLPSLIIIAGGLLAIEKSSWEKFQVFLIVGLPISLIVTTLLIWNRYYGSLLLS